MIRFHSFLFSLKAFSLMDTLYLAASGLTLLPFIFPTPVPKSLPLIMIFIQMVLSWSGPSSWCVMADIHVSVLLRQFLKIGFVIMIIIALIQSDQGTFSDAQDKAGSDFIIIIQIDGTDNSFKGISKNRNPCTPPESSSPFSERMYFLPETWQHIPHKPACVLHWLLLSSVRLPAMTGNAEKDIHRQQIQDCITSKTKSLIVMDHFDHMFIRIRRMCQYQYLAAECSAQGILIFFSKFPHFCETFLPSYFRMIHSS